MGTAGIKFKIMPESPDVDLDDIEQKVKSHIESKGGRNRQYEKQPIAFGLKALIAFFEWGEDQELEPLQEELQKIEDVKSVEVIYMRKLD